MIIGSHVKMNAPEYLLGSVKEALSYDANALMLYTGAPQNTKRVDISLMKVNEAKDLLAKNKIALERMIIHAPYIINLANSVKPEIGELAVEFLTLEMSRVKEIGAKYIVLHPGSYTTSDLDTGIKTIIENIHKLEHDIPDGITICLETMAGKGSEIGRTFEELERLLSGIGNSHFGVCLDTCHIHDAGYDVTDFNQVLDEFDHIIGLQHLHVIHLNDSKNVRGAHKDRHANLGAGEIGFEALCKVACNPRTINITKILETPYIEDKPPYKEEIARLRQYEKEA